MSDTTMTWASVAPASGEIFLVFAICAVLLIDVFAGEKRPNLTPTLTLVVLAITALLLVSVGLNGLDQVGARSVLFDGLYVADHTAFVLKLAAVLFVAVALIYSRVYMSLRGSARGEYYVLTLTALLGIFVLASAIVSSPRISALSCWRCRCTRWWPSSPRTASRPRRP